jgi:nitrogen fixation NifU-like protein
MVGNSSDKIRDHFEYPRNVRTFDQDAVDVGTGIVGNPFQGDVIKLQIKVNTGGVIAAAGFKAYGGVPTIAAGSLVTEWLQGRTLAEAGAISNGAIAEALSLPPEQIHCAVLVEAAIQAAIADYAAKQSVPNSLSSESLE